MRLLLNRITQVKENFRFYKSGHSPAELRDTSDPIIFPLDYLELGKETPAPVDNHGKKWTPEEENKVTQLFKAGKTFKQIAKQVSRGENGVRIKLINLGVAEEGDWQF